MIKMKYLFIILFLFFQQSAWGENILTDFLVAKPYMKDSRFKETVIIMLYHNQEEGAAGLVVNKPIEKMFISELFEGSGLIPPEKMAKKEFTLYWGGPVNPEHIFFIHSSDYKSNDFILSNKNFIISRASEILFDIAENKGPKEFIILSGIAVWAPGQLDSEMVRGDWDKKLNSYMPLFGNRNEMWSRLINSKDI